MRFERRAAWRNDRLGDMPGVLRARRRQRGKETEESFHSLIISGFALIDSAGGSLIYNGGTRTRYERPGCGFAVQARSIVPVGPNDRPRSWRLNISVALALEYEFKAARLIRSVFRWQPS